MISDFGAFVESFVEGHMTSEVGSSAGGGGVAPPNVIHGPGNISMAPPDRPLFGPTVTMERPPSPEGRQMPSTIPPLGQPDENRRSQEEPAIPNRRFQEGSNPPSPGRRSMTPDEAVSEVRRLRDEIRQMHLDSPTLHHSLGRGGESYKLPVPNKYSPKGNKSPLEFLFQCDEYFEASGIPGDKRVPIAVTLLEDAAIAWWRQHKLSWTTLPLGERIVTWEQFKHALHSTFTPVTEKQLARDKLYFLKQLGSVQSYTALFLQLTFAVDDLGEPEKLSLYRRGLKSTIQVHLALARVNTLEEAISTAEMVDVALHSGDGEKARPPPRVWNRPSARGARKSLNALEIRDGGIDDSEDGIAAPGRGTADSNGGIADPRIRELLELAALLKKGPPRNKGANGGGREPTQRYAPGPGKPAARVRCYLCHELGHFQKDCPLKGQTQ